MATTLKVLGQAVGSAGNTDTDLYTVPAATQAVVSSIVVSNQAAASRTYQIRVRVNGVAAATKQLIAKDVSLAPNSSDVWTLGLTLGAADVITFQASGTDVSFSAFGQENS